MEHAAEFALLRARIAELEAACADLEARCAQFDQYPYGPLACQSLDAAGRLADVNQAWLDSLGYTREEVIGRAFTDFLPPDQRQCFGGMMSRIEALDEILGAELAMAARDGSTLWGACNIRAERDAQGRLLKTRWVFIDITARLLAENERRENEMHLKAILNASTETIQLLDTEGRTIIANEASAKRLHVSVDDLIGRPVFDFFPPAVAEQRRECCRQVVATGQPLTVQDERDGIAFEAYLYPVADEQGVVRRIALFSMDITRRKAMERQLAESHALLANLANQVPGVVYQYRLYPDGRSCFPYASPGIWNIYEVTPEQVREDAAPVFDRLHPADHDRVAEAILASARTLETFFCEFKVILPRQGLRWYWSQAQPQRLEDGGTLWHGIISDITARKQAEETLRAREHYLHTILQTSVEGFWVLDTQGRVVEVNNAYLAMTGYSRREILRLSISDLDAIESPDQIAVRIQRIIANGSELFESRHRRKDGSLFPVEVSVTWLDEEGGRMVCFCRDLSERKRAEEALRHSHELMRHLIEHTNSGVAVHDRNLRYVYVSQRYLEMYGLKGRDVIGQHHYDIFPDLPEKWRDVHRQVLTGKTMSAKRDPYVRADGTMEWTRWECRPWYESPGTIGGLIVYTEVITEQVLAEEALRKSEEFQRALIDASPLAIISLDPEGQVLSWNRAAERIFGWSEKEALGQFLLIGNSEQAETLAALRTRILAGETLSRLELHLCHKDGSPIVVSLSTAPIRNPGGELIAIMSVLEDISERKRAEEEKKLLAVQLQQAQKMEAIGTLAGGIAHDFNNLLGVIIGYGEIAKEALPDHSTTARDLEKILEAGERAADLVKQILAFGRRANVEKIPLEPVHLVKEAVKLLRATLPSTITIRQQLSARTGTILADPTQIHQIVMNLCTNAFHAMEQTGGVLDITLAECERDVQDLLYHPQVRPGKFVMLTVADTGPGIPPEIRDKIFEPYFTTKGVGKGTGLGLAIVHGIVADTGGFITCESEPGQGTAFHVFLPAHEASVPLQDKAADTSPSGRERILLVDDEAMLAEMGKTMLERLGYTVISQTSSLEALAMFQQRPRDFDAVITDQTMPSLTGIDLAQRMLRIRPDLPIILCTGFSSLVNEQQAKACGVRGFLMKPLTKKGLAELLRRVLDEGRGTSASAP